MIGVDLKITDYCTFGCPFCYQGSTLKGKHADWNYLKSVVDLLYKEDVFEVVLGGGEPSFYPHLSELLVELWQKRFTVAMTTKNKKLFSMPFWKDVLTKVDYPRLHVGFSFGAFEEADEDIEALNALLNSYNKAFLSPQLTVILRPHLIEGVSFRNGEELYELLKKIVNKVDENAFNTSKTFRIDGVLLLGFKENERGAEYKNHTHIDTKSIHQALYNLRSRGFIYSPFGLKVLVDIVIIDKYSDIFEGGEKFLFKEGEYTFYIDAVEKKISISSYRGNKYQLINLEEDYYSFLKNRKDEIK